MGLVIRQSISSTIISYAGVVIGYVNLLYLYPKFLTTDQVGLFRTIQDAAILFSPFAQFGVTFSIYKFYPQFARDKKSSHTFISFMILCALAGFTVFLICFKIFEKPALGYFEENAREIIQYASLVLWLTLILVMSNIMEAFSRSLLKTVLPNFLREVFSRLLLSVLVLLYFKGVLSYDQFIIGSLLANLLSLLILVINLLFSGNLSFTLDFSAIPKKQRWDFFRYSGLSFASMAGMILIGKIDSMMVAAMLGLAANAVYTTAFYMATVIEIPKRALTQIMMPLISRAFEKNDISEVDTLYRKTSINQFIIGSLVLIGVWINLGNLFHFMPNGKEYELGKWVVLIIGAGKLIDMLFGPSSEIIVLSKYFWFNLILTFILAMLVIVSNNLLIPYMGINGAACGSALALILFNGLKYVFIYAKFNIQPFTLDTLKVAGIAAFTLAVNSLIPPIETILIDLLLRSVVAVLVFGVLILVSKASPEANQLMVTVKSFMAKRLGK